VKDQTAYRGQLVCDLALW